MTGEAGRLQPSWRKSRREVGGQRRRKGRRVPGGGERPFVTQTEEQASPRVGVGGDVSLCSVMGGRGVQGQL